MGKTAGVAAAVKRAVHAGNRFTRSVEASDGLHIPAQNLKVLSDTHAAAGEVVPREHADHVVGALADLVLLIGAPELVVNLRVNGLVPDGDLIFESRKIYAAFFAEFFKRIALPEVFLLGKLGKHAFFRPGWQTHQCRKLDLL